MPLVPFSIHISQKTLPSTENYPVVMANRYAPIVIPTNLHDLPQGYCYEPNTKIA